MKSITLLSTQEIDRYINHDQHLIDELEKQGYKVQSKAWETFEDEGEDLFLIRTTWNYIEHLENFISRLEPIKDRLWNPLPLVKWNSNKKYLLELQEKGLGVMPLKLVQNQSELLAALEEVDGQEFVVKPPVSAGAHGLIRFKRSEAPTINSEMILQKFYPEITQGEVSLFYFNGAFAYAVKKTPKEGEIRVQEEFGGKITPYKPLPEEFSIAESVLAETPSEWLYARVDIVPGLGLIELECIEPSLYLSSYESSAKLFVEALSKKLD